MKKMLVAMLVMALQIISSALSAAAAEDACPRGTWQIKDGVVLVCPNPGSMEWGVSTPKDMVAPQKWETFKGTKKILNSGESTIFSGRQTSLIRIFCDAGSINPKKETRMNGYSVKKSGYWRDSGNNTIFLCQ